MAWNTEVQKKAERITELLQDIIVVVAKKPPNYSEQMEAKVKDMAEAIGDVYFLGKEAQQREWLRALEVLDECPWCGKAFGYTHKKMCVIREVLEKDDEGLPLTAWERLTGDSFPE